MKETKGTKLTFIRVDENSFEKEVLESKCLTIVLFYANWAGSCYILKSTLKEIIEEYKDIIKITEVNIDNNAKLNKELGIKSIPTLLFYKDRKFLDATYGAIPKILIKEKITRYAY